MKFFRTRKMNLAGSFVFLIIGVLTFTQMSTLNETNDGSDPGAAGYPNLIASAMVILAVLLAFQRDSGEVSLKRAELFRVVAAIAVTIAYISVLDPLGYVLSTTLFLASTLLLMGIRSVFVLVLVPLGLALINFYLFYVGFGVPLPYTFIEGFLS